MRIRRLKLSNFRSVAEGEVVFPGHTVIIGGNSVGKSTICEALDLLLGPDRLSRSTPIDEHDFFQRRYLDADGAPILIELEVVPALSSRKRSCALRLLFGPPATSWDVSTGPLSCIGLGRRPVHSS